MSSKWQPYQKAYRVNPISPLDVHTMLNLYVYFSFIACSDRRTEINFALVILGLKDRSTTITDRRKTFVKYLLFWRTSKACSPDNFLFEGSSAIRTSPTNKRFVVSRSHLTTKINQED